MRGSLKTMKTINKITSLFLCAALLAGLCACGGDKQAQGTTANEGTNMINQIINSSDSADYLLSEYLASGETIWFEIDENEGKDSDVDRIFVFESDGTLYYVNNPSYKLGELEQMEDADIIAFVKDKYAADCAKQMLNYPDKFFDDPDEDINTIADRLLGSDDSYVVKVFQCPDELYSTPREILLQEWFSQYSFEDILTEEWDSVEAAYNAYIELFNGTERDSVDCYYLVAMALAHSPDAAIEAYADLYGNDSHHYLPDNITVESLGKAKELLKAAAIKIYDKIKARYDECLKSIAATPYKLALESDSTGNNTAEEVIAYQYPDNYSESGYSVKRLRLTYLYPVTDLDGSLGNCNMIVYDSRYGGYFEDGDYLFTRMDSNAHFQLDEVGSAKLPVDVDINTLFE